MRGEYSYFSHRSCEYFPCHKGTDTENFNCLFCYCPLYILGDQCGGSYKYLKNGVKSCEDCDFPHHRENYDAIVKRFQEITAVMAALRADAQQKTPE